MKKKWLFPITFFIFAVCEEKMSSVPSYKKPVIYLILGSTREGRSSEKIAKALQKIVPSQDASFETVDLKDFDLPFLYESVSPSKGPSKDKRIQAWSQKIKQADGLIFLVPEYNGSFSAVLKNALDVLYNEWNDKPTLFIGYAGGPDGGAHALDHLKLVADRLHMKVVSPQITIPKEWQAFDGKGNFKDSQLIKAIQHSTAELIKQIKNK
jgi:NAD(P)H-dependent FMN reductase